MKGTMASGQCFAWYMRLDGKAAEKTIEDKREDSGKEILTLQANGSINDVILGLDSPSPLNPSSLHRPLALFSAAQRHADSWLVGLK
jgi:hypothetical protein